MSMNNAFCKNLKRIRTEKGMNQAQLADKVGYKQVTISAWEVGRSEPSMGDIAKLAEALDCSQEELIGIEKKMGNITFEDMLIKVNTLNTNELEKLMTVVEQQLRINIEIEKLEKAKEEQTKILMEYEKRLAELTGR